MALFVASSLLLLNAIAIVIAPAAKIKMPIVTISLSNLAEFVFILFVFCGVGASALTKAVSPNKNNHGINGNITKLMKIGGMVKKPSRLT